MDWLRAAEALRARREPGVLVTLLDVHGHAPRPAGAKLVVSATDQWGSIGGGNLEATAVQRARALLDSGGTLPEQLQIALSDRTTGEHAAQCCGGRVAVVLEPLPVRPAVAIFGLGHVGLELARILARMDLDLHLIDSRADRLTEDVLGPLQDAVARLERHHAPDPTTALTEVPRSAHLLILTHDHAQDFALCDAALRGGHLGTIGLIGSSAKWGRFKRRLSQAGHPAQALARIRTPVGLPEVAGKDPASIAVSVAAELLVMTREGEGQPRPGPVQGTPVAKARATRASSASG